MYFGGHMFVEERQEPTLEWSMLGDIATGRPNLGGTTSVSMYRLMQFSLRDTAIQQCGVEGARKLFYNAGKHAGRLFCGTVLSPDQPVPQLLNRLQVVLRELNVAVLRVEKLDPVTLAMTLTLAEDLDCSGLFAMDEQVCTWDEGFIAGMLGAATNREFEVREVDCWCSGDRVCRFDVKPVE